jgi:hypothetical protein
MFVRTAEEGRRRSDQSNHLFWRYKIHQDTHLSSLKFSFFTPKKNLLKKYSFTAKQLKQIPFMPGMHRHYLPGLARHITHRCHKQEFLLRFEKRQETMASLAF